MNTNNEAFAIYNKWSRSLTFHKNGSIPKKGEIYKYVEDDGNLVKKQVTEVYQNIENLTYDHYKVPWYKHIREIIYVEVVDKISPTITASWFSEFLICEKFKLNKLDISNATDMSCMFYCAGYNTKTFDLDLNSWNTSKVKDMKYMFWCAGYDATTWNIEGLETWDVSNVINMREMFTHAGYNAEYQLDLSSWDVSNATFYCHFNNGIENKIIAPTWHHNTDD